VTIVTRIAVAAVAAALLAPACKRADGPQVAFLLSNLRDERYAKDVRYFEARAHALGMRTMTLVADDDNARQIAQVEEALTRGAKVIVVQPADSQAASSYVRLAHEHAAKVIAYDRTIVAPDLDYFISHDSYQVGVLQARAAIEATHGHGNYVLLAGQAGHSVALDIMRGYHDTLAPYVARGDIQIVSQQHHSAWSAEQAQRTVSDAISYTGGHVDAILANNSGLARGAVQAVADAGLGHVFIAGADADAANVNYVCQGKQSIEVLKDVQPLARTAAELAHQLLAGEAPTSSPRITVGVELVTPDNVKPLLVDRGILNADDLPACKSQLATRK
jgi:D-xylose transport system substrate-binding protein